MTPAERIENMITEEMLDLKVLHLYNDDGTINEAIVHQSVESIASGEYDVVDYITTYGTRYLYTTQAAVFTARGDISNKPSSLVSRYKDAIAWVDLEKLHPTARAHVEAGKLKHLVNVCFVVFPGNSEGEKQRPLHNNELQVFFTPDDDPFLSHLVARYGILSYCVTSSNLPAKPEEYTFEGSKKYAIDINAKHIVSHSKKKLENEHKRLRVGSQPQIRLPQNGEPAEIQILRLGNTGLNTLNRLLTSLFPEFTVTYKPAKPETHRRPYESPDHLTHFEEIVQDLFRASFGE